GWHPARFAAIEMTYTGRLRVATCISIWANNAIVKTLPRLLRAPPDRLASFRALPSPRCWPRRPRPRRLGEPSTGRLGADARRGECPALAGGRAPAQLARVISDTVEHSLSRPGSARWREPTWQLHPRTSRVRHSIQSLPPQANERPYSPGDASGASRRSTDSSMASARSSTDTPAARRARPTTAPCRPA